MTKDGIIKCLLSLVLTAYLVVALSFTSQMAASDTFSGLQINVADSLKRGFVTSDDIAEEIGYLGKDITTVRHDSLDTYSLTTRLMEKDNIESVNCVVLNNGTLRIDVVPLIPMARVFDTNGENYYINRAGKRMKADTQYRMDVPVITGTFSPSVQPSIAFPLIDYLDTDPDMSAMVSSIDIRANGDLVVVPSIKGHVVNIGDTLDLANKFRRLKIFYRKVMPVKGWTYYDEVSVKWRGQVVARQRHQRDTAPAVITEEHDDIDDEGTMLTLASSGAAQPLN